MSRAKRKAVSKHNGAIPQDNLSLVDSRWRKYIEYLQKIDKCFDRKISPFNQRFEDMEEEDKNTHHLARLQHQAQQPRPVAEAKT